MKLRSSAGLLVVLASAALPAVASAAINAAAGDRVAATLDACHADPVQAARYATFGGEMSQIKGGRSMAVRFDLYRRDPGAGFRPVAVPAPGFGVWHRSAPGVGILRYSQEVASLPAPASYRVLAGYRWFNARRHVIRRAHRTTPTCVLPDERPKLVASQITVRRGPDSDTALYDVAVANDGLRPAGPFAVAFSVAGQALPEQTIGGLAPAERHVLSFLGPRCTPGDPLTAIVDRAGSIDETTRADNVRSITC